MRFRLERFIKNVNVRYFLAFVLVALVFIGMFSYASPLYYFDYSPDVNCFFTVGKGMMHGLVPYKDVFEQKGPYVYLLYGLAYLISHYSIIGITIVEIISLATSMFLVFKAAHLYINKPTAAILALITPFFLMFQEYFTYGGLVEEFVFPMILSAVYLTFKACNDHFMISKGNWLIQGFLVGVVFLSKYTLLGTWVAFYIIFAVVYLYHRQFNSLFKMAIASGIGFLLSVVPWGIYFLVTNSFKAFYDVYFVSNMTVYNTSVGGGILTKIAGPFAIFSEFLIDKPQLFVLGAIPLALFVVFNKGISKVLFLCMMFVSAFFAVYSYTPDTLYVYYQLAFMPYVVITLVILVAKLLRHQHFKLPRERLVPMFIGMALLMLFFTMGVNDNFQKSKLFPDNNEETLDMNDKQTAQQKFGKIMREESKGTPTLLNYGYLDLGMYTVSGALPTQYYFQINNIPYDKNPKIVRSQNKAVQDKAVQWIVVKTNQADSIKTYFGKHGSTRPASKTLLENYRVVSTHEQKAPNNRKSTYWLLKRR
ncbi:teichoic acid polysaccharide glycosyl transferase [Fructilactobacillus fructivorans]|uniref:ArnT family glycosyltransferase n=1 Tax=Fructilactobacillus fructivorans TaxID=1614 RepID=UPI0007049203|nr:glycosyltransferase family 39 protein [Fructilactobacillus fructivorans]KRN12121.1 teichoic acid polysaccharide glycosyl transferase [Fructilactobacillus fructivorans]